MGKNYNRILFFFVFVLILYDVFYEYIPVGLMFVIQTLSLIWMMLSVPVYFRQNHKSTFITCSLLLVIDILLSFFLTGASGTTFLKTCLFCMVIIFPFTNGWVSYSEFRRFSIIAIILSLIVYVIMLSKIRGSGDELAYGSGYVPVVILPLGLFLLRNKSNMAKLLYSISILTLVLFSAKRGDILSCMLAILTYFLLSSQRRKQGKVFNRIFSILFLVIVGIVLFNFFLNNFEVFQYKYEQTSEGYSSGRDELYQKIWDYYLASSWDKQLLGYGFDGVPRFIGGRAHNDWLEIIFGEGVIGAIIYLILVLSIVPMIFGKRVNMEYRPFFGSVLVIWIVKSIFSMFLFSMPTILLFALIGYLMGSQQNNEQLIK